MYFRPQGAEPLADETFQKALSSVTTLIKSINQTETQEKRSMIVSIDTTDNNFNFKVTERTEALVNDKLGLNSDELIEVKQLLKAFHLNDEKSLNESLAKFLNLRDDSVCMCDIC